MGEATIHRDGKTPGKPPMEPTQEHVKQRKYWGFRLPEELRSPCDLCLNMKGQMRVCV